MSRVGKLIGLFKVSTCVCGSEVSRFLYKGNLDSSGEGDRRLNSVYGHLNCLFIWVYGTSIHKPCMVTIANGLVHPVISVTGTPLLHFYQAG